MINGEKNVIKEAKLPCEEAAIERFLGGIPKECLNVVMEACGIWHGLYDYLVERCNVVKVANPMQTKLNSSGKKTDKLDSKRLAELLKAGMINESYVPQKDARDYRSKIRHRQSMVSISTELKNQIHATLREENIKHPKEFEDIFTKKGITWLKHLRISEIDNCLELITAANVQIKNADHLIPDDLYRNEIRLLKTMPGVGDITAPVIMSEIVDIKRFENPKALCKYAGLVPKVIQSGESDRRGRLVKQSSKILRTALIQCAQGVLKKKDGGKLKMFFLKMAKKKKSNTAVTALAHKMLYIMWFMLTNNEGFHDGGTQVGE
jgi:transposase